MRNEIDGKPVQDRLVSALLLGTNVVVPKGKDVGAFKTFRCAALHRKPDA